MKETTRSQPLRPCSIPGCDKPFKARGMCGNHWLRWRRYGDATTPKRPTKTQEGPCLVEGCSTAKRARGLCATHWAQQRRGVTLALREETDAKLCVRPGCAGKAKIRGFCQACHMATKRKDAGPCSVEGCPNKGNPKMCARHEWNQRMNGDPGPALGHRKKAYGISRSGYRTVSVDGLRTFEHRAVMERHLGRKLLPHENVHHLNGDRLDNRLENLELWSHSQPPGQRVADKVAWAIEVLRLWKPEALAAEGEG